MELTLRDKIRLFEKKVFEPLALKFDYDNEPDSIFQNLQDEQTPKPEDKLDYLYSLLEDVIKAKSQADFLLWTATYNDNFEADELEYADFVYGSDCLLEMELKVKSKIDIIENGIGKRYWQENNFKGKKIIGDNQTTEEINAKDILLLILKTSENHLFEQNNTAIGEAIYSLTNKKFSVKKVAESIGGTNKKFKKEIYEEAIKKLEAILKELKKSTPGNQ